MAETHGAVVSPAAETGRVPPHDIEAEKAVLSALLIENEAIHSVLNEVKPEDFYHPSHQQIYRAMLALQDDNDPVDLHTLSDYLNARKQLDAVGGLVFLSELADYAATAANVQNHARIIRDKSVKRNLIRVASQIAESSFEQMDDAEHLLDEAESRIFELGQEKARTTFTALDVNLQTALDHVEALMAKGGELTGAPTGFKDLDADTGGLQPGELIVIAARPSMGKTALALNIARSAAVDHRKKVAIFSLEMTNRALTLRLLSSQAGVNMNEFRKGFGHVDAYKRLNRAAGELSGADLWIDDTGMITILEVKAKCRRLKSEMGLDLVMLDYLQLAHGNTPTQRKDLEIAEISHGLKALAKELDIPVVALSQLNRGPEQRDPDKRRPNMGDLRESGAIEQDADVVAFIYRDEVYNRDNPENKGIAEIIIEKQRNGPTGTIKLQFDGQYARFRDLSNERRRELGMRDDAGFVGGAGMSPGSDDFDPPPDIEY
jgi:replicative DNA helicase